MKKHIYLQEFVKIIIIIIIFAQNSEEWDKIILSGEKFWRIKGEPQTSSVWSIFILCF